MTKVLITKDRSKFFGKILEVQWTNTSWVMYYDKGFYYFGPGDFVIAEQDEK